MFLRILLLKYWNGINDLLRMMWLGLSKVNTCWARDLQYGKKSTSSPVAIRSWV